MPILYVSLQSRSSFPPDFRWTDPHTWPWMIWVWAGFFVLSWLAPLWRWYQRDRVTSWLSAIGVVESIGEPEPRSFLGMNLSQNPSQGALEIRYSYSPLGQSYRGRHKIDRASKFNLDEFTNRLIGLPVQVQYHPDKPAVSALMDSSIEALLRQAPPLSQQEEQLIRAAHEIPAVYLPWLLPLMYLALAGFLISFCINIASLLGIVLPHDAPFVLLHVGIFVVFFPAILAAKKMVGYTNGRYFWKRLMNGTPEGFRYLFYVVFGYCWLIGFLSFSQPFPAKDPSSFLSTRSEWLSFSAVWMVFYFSSFVILLSARNYSLKSSSHR